MANFSSLKQAIQNYIKENGNKEITGNLLQEILLSMVVTMGDNAINSLTTVVNELNTILHSVDAEPTKNSVNLVRSGGVWSGINREALRAFNAETFEARFNSTNNRVEFFNQSGDMLYWYDASAFVTTGLVEDVYIENDNLVFVINTSAGEKTIEVPLEDVFNPNNYYTKTQIDGIVRAIRELYDGAEYRGFITPSSQAESKQGVKMVCFATEAGTYTNFLANYDTPIEIPVRGIWIFERGVDADDWTAYSLLEIDKVYAPAQASGMGRVVLQKNMVNGVNTLTQDMFYKGAIGSREPNTNTIFVIQYDFTFGEDITVPANCVLEFDGGSVSASGNNDTIIGQDTEIEATGTIFKDVKFDGTWNINEILVNWFISDSDSDMFQAAFDFASAIKNTTYGYGKLVTCIQGSYTIDKTIFIDDVVSFNGNNSNFSPTSDMAGKYMFACNTTDFINWKQPYPGNQMTKFGNMNVNDFEGYGAYLLCCADSRRIHDIKTRGLRKLIYYSGGYLDGRVIENVFVMNRHTAIDYSSWANETNTCDVFIGIGDNVTIVNCAFSAAIQTGANVNIDSFMGFLAIKNSQVNINNAHTEQESFIDAYGKAIINITNAYVFAITENTHNWNIRSQVDVNGSYPQFIINNLRVDKLRFVEETYQPILGKGNFILENVYGELSGTGQWTDDRGDGFKVQLRSPIDVNKFIKGDFEIISNNINMAVPVFQTSDVFNVLENFTSGNSGTSWYVRVIYIDPKYGYFAFKAPYIVGMGDNTNSLRKLSLNNPTQGGQNYVIRIEFGTDGENWTHYYDLHPAGYGIPIIPVEKTQDGYTCFGFAAKTIGYTSNSDSYVVVSGIKKYGNVVEFTLDENTVNVPYYALYTVPVNTIFRLFNGIELKNAGTKLVQTISLIGAENERPTRYLSQGQTYYDTTHGRLVQYNGSRWNDWDGAIAGVRRKGTFAQKPAVDANIYEGFGYFCTDRQTTEGATNGIMIYYKGSGVWVDALGRVVS